MIYLFGSVFCFCLFGFISYLLVTTHDSSDKDSPDWEGVVYAAGSLIMGIVMLTHWINLYAVIKN